MIIVKSLSTQKKNGQNLVKIEIYNKDIAEDVIFTIPGFESLPLKDNNMLCEDVEGGDRAVFLVPMKTDIEAGERRIYCTTSTGALVSEIYLKKDGKIRIKNNTAELIAELHNLATAVKDIISNLVATTVPTALGPQTLSSLPDFTEMLLEIQPVITKIASFKE